MHSFKIQKFKKVLKRKLESSLICCKIKENVILFSLFSIKIKHVFWNHPEFYNVDLPTDNVLVFLLSIFYLITHSGPMFLKV